MTTPIVIGLALREDDSAPLAPGTAMARLTGAPIALVSAFVHDPMPAPPPIPLDAPLLDASLAALEEHAERLRGEHDVTVHAHRGSPARVLHQISEQLDAGLLVVGSSHRGRVGRVLSGSVTAGLLHGATCAVAVAPWDYAGANGFGRIAVAYDGSEESRDALIAAVGLALFGGGTTHAYTVLEPVQWGPAAMTPAWTVPPAYEESRQARAEAVAAEVSSLVLDGAEIESEVLVGRASDTLAALSDGFDLLVCGSRGYGPLRSVALGGVSRALVNEVACPVLVLPRPPAKGRQLWSGHRDAVAGAGTMRAFSRVLVGIGGSERSRDALALAGRLIDPAGGELILAWIDGDRSVRLPLGHARTGAGSAAALAAGREQVAAAIPVTEISRSATSVARGLTELAEETRADLVVVGSGRHGLAGRITPGRTGMRLLQGAPCAVAIAPQGLRDGDPFRHVGVAYDGSPEAAAAPTRSPRASTRRSRCST